MAGSRVRLAGWMPPLLAVACLAAAATHAVAADAPAPAAPVVLTSPSGQVRMAKRDITCAAPQAAGRQPLGALLAEPGGESLYPYALGLTALVAHGDQGYALTAATRAFTTGPARGGGDVLLAGIDRQFNPRWATVFGGPSPDGPSSLARTADGGLAVVGITQSAFTGSARWFGSNPEVALIAKFDAVGRLEWAQVHQPGDDVGANPVVAPPGGGIVFGGVAWRDGRNAGFLTWLDERGATQWSRWLGRDFEDGVTWIVPASDASLFVTGARLAARPAPKTDPAARAFDIWAAKFANDGRVIWARTYALGSGGARVVAAGDRAGGFLIAREPRVDDQARTSRLPVIAIDAQGTVAWAWTFEFDGEAAVSAIVDAGPDRYLLFGTALPVADAGGPFVLAIDRAGRIIDSAWIDLAAAASTPERRAIVGIDPVSVVRDDDGSFVLMGDIVDVSRALIAKAQARPGQMPPALKSDLKGQIYLLRVDARGRAGDCSRPWVVRQQALDVQASALDLPTVEIPPAAARSIPIDRLGVERLGPP